MKNILPIAFLLLMLFSYSTEFSAQEPSAILYLESTEQGFLPPRMDASDRDAIVSPADGLVIFNISTGVLNYYDAVIGQWFPIEANSTLPDIPTLNQSLIIPATSFNSANHITTSTLVGSGGVYMNTTGTGLMLAPITLPIGSTINAVTYYYKDETNDSQMTIQLIEEDMLTTFSSLNTFSTGVVDSDPNFQTETININHVIANNKSYFILVLSTDWSVPDLKIKGVKLDYTLPAQ